MDLIEICRVQGENEADLVQALLKANGIESIVTGNAVHSVLPFTVDGLGELRVMVRESDAEMARGLLKEDR